MNICANEGLMYEKGVGTQPSFKKALALSYKACKGGVSQGCFNLGNLYHNENTEWEDKQRAKIFYGKACELGHQDGCSNYRIMNK